MLYIAIQSILPRLTWKPGGPEKASGCPALFSSPQFAQPPFDPWHGCCSVNAGRRCDGDPSIKTAQQVFEALQRGGEWEELTLATVRRAVTAANARRPQLTAEEKVQQ